MAKKHFDDGGSVIGKASNPLAIITGGPAEEITSDLTVWDFYAAHAMTAMAGETYLNSTEKSLASEAAAMADAMMLERRQRLHAAGRCGGLTQCQLCCDEHKND